MDELQQIGRLALRHEGNFWNAYYALVGSMDGALLLGSIAMAAVTNNPDRKEAFMDMMRGVVSDLLEQNVGVRPDWPDEPQTAPEHERAGHS